MGARFLSSTGLGSGNLIERAQFPPAPALDKNWSPIYLQLPNLSFYLPCVTEWLPTDISYFGINYGIAVVDSLPTLIVWELITDCRYRLCNFRIQKSFLAINSGITVADLKSSELISVRITVTDTDFNFWHRIGNHFVTMRHKIITCPKKILPELFWNYRYPIWAFPN